MERSAARRRPDTRLLGRQWLRIAALAGLLLAGCSAPAPPLRDTLFVFGGEAQLELRGVSPDAGQAALAELSAHLATLHADWHPWEPGALTELNAALRDGRPYRPPASILALIRRAQPLSLQSGGLFDPAAGGLIARWGFHTSDYPVTTPPPDAASIAAWRAAHPRITDLVLDGDTVRSLQPAVQLDFGAIAEGVASESALAILRRHGVRNALLSLGGDVVALGDADGRPWSVALRDPYGGVLGSVALHDGEALFSSGNYNKFRVSPEGGRWPHILDPRTGYPAEGSAAVVVIHRDPVRADAASTALFVGGPALFAALAHRLEIRCALLLTEENELMITAPMAARVTLLRQPVPLGPPLGAPGSCHDG